MKVKSILMAVAFAAHSVRSCGNCAAGDHDDRPPGRRVGALGGALKGMWEKAIPGLQVQMQPGAGIANIRGVDEGKAHVGFGNTITTVDGLAGRPPFPKQSPRSARSPTSTRSISRWWFPSIQTSTVSAT